MFRSPDITRQFSCPLRLLPPVLLFLKPSTLLRHPRSSRFAKRLSTGHSRRPATIESYRFVVEALPQHSFLSWYVGLCLRCASCDCSCAPHRQRRRRSAAHMPVSLSGLLPVPQRCIERRTGASLSACAKCLSCTTSRTTGGTWRRCTTDLFSSCTPEVHCHCTKINLQKKCPSSCPRSSR